ncbi:MAG: deoxyribose-phosphate aldolase [Methanobrevibacter sp.]|uniref:deoxyribose-phosphate aldolase n=1 Tax=Methanobrevibacter sp. TaxID=66852 RepID=UPI001B2A9687|nr:deoxyribose-phosphate aldolase [Methanobrevibacter sp.]MBO5151196.1 deoxyribose-phosphate aldolase [Methanobrevibacter sp.]
MYRIKNSKHLASVINYTNLNNMISEAEMKEFLNQAKEMNFNAVTINPTYVPLASEILADCDTKVGSVVGFPLGCENTESKIAEAKSLIENGADEINAVINLNHVASEKYDLIEEEAKLLKEAVGDKTLKMIIESKILEDEQKANIVIRLEKAGIDYLKTSTGFVTPNHIYEIVNDINIFLKYAPKTKIEVYDGIDIWKMTHQVLTAGADIVASNNGYEIVSKYKELRENTQIKPKPISLKK